MEGLKKAMYVALACLCLGGTVHAQDIDLTMRNVTVKQAIDELKEKSGYSFVFSSEDLDTGKRISVSLDNAGIREAVNQIVAGQNVSYEIKGKDIIIRRMESGRPEGGKTVKGTVTDAFGEPVIGATIAVKGSSTQVTISDIDGNFTLTDVPADAVLSVSCLGFSTMDVTVTGQESYTIQMTADIEALDEVVIIGYGTTSAKKLVSSVTAVDGEDLQDLPFANITQTLQGRAAGVIVQNSGGEPGSAPSISIRGGGNPVYVIDGVISNDGWDFTSLNPEDIESISVLKDAASLAVYGSRAADGIILVKTKEGHEGKRKITYSFNAQFSQPTFLPEKIGSYDYASVQNTAAMLDGYPDYYVYSADELELFRNQSDPYHYPDTDWYSLALKNFAPEYRHSLSLTGNQKDVNYYISLGIFDQGSIYTANTLHYTRYNLRSNLNTTFEEIGLKVALNINASYEKKKWPSYSAGDIWYRIREQNPVSLAYNADGTYSTVSDHPLVAMDERSGYDKNDGMFINAQLMADWQLPWVKGLSFGAMFNYRLNASHVKGFSAQAPQYFEDGTQLEVAKPSLREESYFGDYYNFEASASYLRTFADVHSIDAKVVFTASEYNGSNFWASRRDYLSTNVDQLFAGSSTSMENSGNGNEGGRMGLVGRVKYDYASRYYIELSCRYDGSDNFAPGYRWGFFPSIALGWDITEEPFFKKLNARNINLIKLRGSYGQMGTESGVNRFGYLSTYNMTENAIVIGGNLQSGFKEGALVAPDQLSWYTRTSLDYGLDVAFFNHRLKGSADYFFYVTRGGLMSPTDRYTTPLGTSLPQIKSDTEQRREGFELQLSWSDNIGDFSYSVGTNMTYYNNLYVKNQSEALSTTMNPYKRGTHQTDYWGVIYFDDGLYQTPEQLLGTPRRLAGTELRLGDIAYKDLNGDGKIDEEDQARFGMPTAPHFTYGIDFMFSYKGFTLSGLFYGTGRRDMEFGYQDKIESRHILNNYQLDFWTSDNTDAVFPRTSLVALRNDGNNNLTSTFWLRNAAYLRLKNLTLSYDFKHKLLKNADWLSSLSVNLTGSNLFVISGVNGYWDPEAASTDSIGYPVQRVYSIGVTVGF